MNGNVFKYIWRCAKCSCHFANIQKMDGNIKQEKKCPKCKSLNILSLQDNEIFIQCRIFDTKRNGYENEVPEIYGGPC